MPFFGFKHKEKKQKSPQRVLTQSESPLEAEMLSQPGRYVAIYADALTKWVAFGAFSCMNMYFWLPVIFALL